LVSKYPAVTVAAVNQCSGNSRSRLQPRVPGGQWGNGAMGNAVWTGARLSSLLEAAEVQPGAVAVQFEGLDRGRGPIGKGSHRFLKSLNLDEPALHDSLVAYAMNGEPLPMLNGFPIRLVVPGWFATYWVQALTWIRVLDQPDDNFWMKSAYRIPDTPRGSTTPDSARAGAVEPRGVRSEEHTSELQSHLNIVCRLLLDKKKEHRGLLHNQTITRLPQPRN